MNRLCAFACLCLGFTTVGAAQVVQLPTFHSFGSTGAVLVPDRGGAFLGGVGRAANGVTRRGLPIIGGAPHSFGSQVGHAGASVHVTIIDHAALDQQVLQEARDRQRGRSLGNPSASTRGNRFSAPGSFDSVRGQHQHAARNPGLMY